MEENQKDKKVYLYSYIISFIVILGLFSLFIYKANENKTKEVVDTVNNSSITPDNKSIDINNSLTSGDFKGAINELEKKGTGNLEKEEKMKLVYSYLAYGNYFYKEEENSKKAIEILDTLKEESDVLYYKGYANEIIKNYTGALDYYNKGLEQKDLTNEYKSLLLNQKGHLYDLKGEFNKVLTYYDEAYNLDKNNTMVLSNLGRYYARTGEYEKAYEILNQALSLTDNGPLKSEISFGLSSIELELNGLKPDIDKSIDYARQSIKYYPSYPMGYVALSRGLFMKNDLQYNKEIEENLNKSIELNPNGYFAYYIYVLYEIDKSNFEKASDYIKKTMYAINSDMILMDSERETTKNSLMYDSIVIGTLKNGATDQELLMKLINKTGKLKNPKIVFQIKRNNYGIFAPIKDNKEFQELIKNY
ncbi:MAG: hypothetical protein WC850_03950 [Candidatus Gracilibacteria bacterium]